VTVVEDEALELLVAAVGGEHAGVVRADPGPGEPRTGPARRLQTDPELLGGRTRRLGLDQHQPVGMEEVPQAPEERPRVPADADAPVEEERGAPPPPTREVVEHRPLEHPGAPPSGEGHGGRRDLHAERGHAAAAEGADVAPRAAPDVEDRADDPVEQSFVDLVGRRHPTGDVELEDAAVFGPQP